MKSPSSKEENRGETPAAFDWIGPRKGRSLVVGLTGGIGSGKSTVAGMLAERGAAVIDADRYAHDVTAPGQPALCDIAARFGEHLVAGGRLDRAALARVVFSNPRDRQDLEAILYPRIAERVRESFARLEEEGVEVVIFEAALLVEKGIHRSLDGLIVVTACRETQIRRVMERDRVDREEVESRLAAQLPLAEKVQAADWVVDNDGSLEETEARVDETWREIRHAARRPSSRH